MNNRMRAGQSDRGPFFTRHDRRSFITGLAGAAAFGGLLSPASAQAPAAQARLPADAGPGPAGLALPDPNAGKKKLLAIGDVHTGYQHDSVSHALATIEQMGRKLGADSPELSSAQDATLADCA